MSTTKVSSAFEKALSILITRGKLNKLEFSGNRKEGFTRIEYLQSKWSPHCKRTFSKVDKFSYKDTSVLYNFYSKEKVNVDLEDIKEKLNLIEKILEYSEGKESPYYLTIYRNFIHFKFYIKDSNEEARTAGSSAGCIFPSLDRAFDKVLSEIKELELEG
jgi:hypothetical protein